MSSVAPVPTVTLGANALTPADVVAVARGGATVVVSDEAWEAIGRGAALIEQLATDTVPHYGVSTGFGALAVTSIPREKRRQLQRNLIRSHAAGVGPEVEADVVRALMLLRINTLCSGRTGVRPATVATYVALLNAHITPIVHEFGSLGCSGDLAPLAHCALALIGEGQVRDATGTLREAGDALADAGITPAELAEKEGLALINGTDGMLGMLSLALADLADLATLADLAAALTVEGVNGNDAVFAPHIQQLRPYPGQAESASTIHRLLAGSEIIAHHIATGASRVQDAYSIRCAPQVHGALREVMSFAHHIAAIELVSVVDNPIITSLGTLESNGNFHGAPVAYALDMLAIPVADIASMSERRTDRLLDAHRNGGLTPFLADDPGTDSGLMIAQYTQASIVNELKRLANPASADSIPSSAMQEDHVSMGWNAGRKLLTAIEGLRRVIAIEILAASRAVGMRAPLEPGAALRPVIAAIREHVPGVGPDRYLAPEIAVVEQLLADGTLLDATHRALADAPTH